MRGALKGLSTSFRRGERFRAYKYENVVVLVRASNCVDIWWITRALVANRRYERSVPARWSLQGERASRA